MEVVHMSTLNQIIGTDSPTPLSAIAEADLIEQAQAGDHDAMLDLMRQYAPVLRKLRGAYVEVVGQDDAEQELMLAFMDMVKTHDAAINPQLAGRVYQSLTEAMAGASSAASSGFHIPTRTMKRYIGILKHAEQDLRVARVLAPDYGMTVETFDAITRATRTDTCATEDTDEDERGTYAAGANVTMMFPGNDLEESTEMAHFAMSEVTVEQLPVVRHAYGFDPVVVDGVSMAPEGYAPLSDATVGIALGLSRPKVQRLRTAALTAMREALAVEV